MQRILYVCTVPTDKSGIPTVIFNLLSAINQEGIEFGYVAINEPSDSYKEKLKELGVKLYIIPRKLSNPLKYVKDLMHISKDYDIIHVHGNSATMVLEMVAAKLGGIKYRIAHCHNTKCSQRVIDFLARPLFYNLCNGRLACGIEAGKWLYRKRDFKVINNGIESQKFKFNPLMRDEVREHLGWEKNKIIGHIGNFVSQKNHEFLIRVFHEYTKQNPDARLLLLGDGPLKQDVESQINDLKLTDKVLLVGSVDNPQEYLNAMDLVVMPSRFEGLPLTLVEEQANGLQGLVADTITQDANISGNLKFLPLSSSEEIWTETLREMLRVPYDRSVLSRKAISDITKQEYDIVQVGENLIEYYASLVNGKRNMDKIS